MKYFNKCIFCGESKFGITFTVSRKDKFAYINNVKLSPAEYFECDNCKMMLLDDTNDYEMVYSDGSYYTMDGEGDAENFLINRFETIINLPNDKSDNKLRVQRVHNFITQNKKKSFNLLDIGAGMGVFMYEYHKQYNVKGTVLEPEPHAFKHLSKIFENSDIHVEGNLIQHVDFKMKFDLITLNRVLEHVFDPHFFLIQISELLTENGYIYIEVPDVQSYYMDGADNEAFGYGHFHVYSPNGMMNLLNSTELELIHLNRCIEPSGKYTLYVFVQKRSIKGIK